MKSNYLSILIILLLITSTVAAQKVRYKDVFPKLGDPGDEKTIILLKDFLLTDLEHPNTNFLLAVSYEKKYNEADVLQNYKGALMYAEQCALRYLKCRTLVDEKEVSRNEEYYAFFSSGVDKRGRPVVPFEVIEQRIKNGYDSAIIFKNKIPSIYHHFTKAVDYYGTVFRDFQELSNTYKSLDELYMLYDDDVELKLRSLMAFMDSVEYHFNKYKELIGEYPINSYNQNYSLKPIEYFRLDGLSNLSSFLQNSVVLWDYKGWANKVIATHKREIISLRNDINSFEERLNKNLLTLDLSNEIEESDLVKPDKELEFQLNKYDYNSIVLSLLQYKLFKQEVIRRQKQKIFYDTASNQSAFSRFNFYSNLIKNQVVADSLLRAISERNIESRIEKHKDFINRQYNGKKGLDLYLLREKEENFKKYNYYQLSLRNDLIDFLRAAKIPEVQAVKYKGKELPLIIAENRNSAEAQIITTSKASRADSTTYIGGFLINPKNSLKVGFIARISIDNQVEYFKEISGKVEGMDKDVNHEVADLDVTKEGVAFLVKSYNPDFSFRQNRIFYLTDEGEEKINLKLPSESQPREILFDQNAGRFILALKGDTYEQDLKTEEELNIVAINLLGDLLWVRKTRLAGSFETIIDLQNGYAIFGNYTAIKTPEGKEYRSRSQLGETAVYSIKMDNQGSIVDIKAYPESESYYMTDHFKVNDGSINIFGFNAIKDQSNYSLSYSNDKLIYLMLDRDLKKIVIER